MSFYGKARARRSRNASAGPPGAQAVARVANSLEHLRELEATEGERLRAAVLADAPGFAGDAAPATPPAAVASPVSRTARPEVRPWIAAAIGVVITMSTYGASWLFAGGALLIGILGQVSDIDARWLVVASPAVIGAGLAALPIGPFVATATGDVRSGLTATGVSAVLIALSPFWLRRYGLNPDIIDGLFPYSAALAGVFAAVSLPGVMFAAWIGRRSSRRSVAVPEGADARATAERPARGFGRKAPRPSVPLAERRAVYCDACGASNVPGRARCLQCDAYLHEQM